MAPQIDWKNLGFQYMQTDSYVMTTYKDGSWSSLEVRSDPHLSLHIAATALQYGQSVFEGLKAFSRKDGSVALFRPVENARRMINSTRRVMMEAPSEELFIEACLKVVELNREYIPPYGTGASLYLRPFCIGTSPHIGVHPSEEYAFIVLATPMGPYYKDGFFPVRSYVQETFDRAAPRGVGNVKVAGNYAAGLMGDMAVKERGYPICLYLDSLEHKYIDEFGTSNFFGITGDKHYVTPHSESVLPSITNKSLQVIAEEFGYAVEKRRIPVSELCNFSEVGACGTAVIITPISAIVHGETTYRFGEKDCAGPTLTKLYTEIQNIQYGEIEDRHGWMLKVNV